MQPGGRAGGGGGGGVRDNKMEGEKEREGEREKERRQREQLKPLLHPPSPRLPPPSALAHPDHCAPGGVQEINGRMLTTFDRPHKRGHLGSHDATCTPPPHPHLTPTSPRRYTPLHLLHHQHHHPNTGAAGGHTGIRSRQEVTFRIRA